jgi:hypothetical protein
MVYVGAFAGSAGAEAPAEPAAEVAGADAATDAGADAADDVVGVAAADDVVGGAAAGEVGALLEDLLDEHPATVTATATAAPTALIDRRRVVLVFMTFPSMNSLPFGLFEWDSAAHRRAASGDDQHVGSTPSWARYHGSPIRNKELR